MIKTELCLLRSDPLFTHKRSSKMRHGSANRSNTGAITQWSVCVLLNADSAQKKIQGAAVRTSVWPPVVNWRYSVHLSPRATCCLILYHHPRLFPLVFFSRRFGVCFPFEVESNDKWLSGSSQAAVTSSMAGFMANVWPNKIKIEIPLSRVDGPPNWKASRSHPRSSTEMHPNDCIHRKHFKYCFQHLLDTSC